MLLRGEDLGLTARVHELLAVRGRPVQTGLTAGIQGLEARHDVAREQLVGAQGLLAVRPFVGAEQDAAEAACKYFKKNEIACMATKN